jgi:hypothetical protein
MLVMSAKVEKDPEPFIEENRPPIIIEEIWWLQNSWYKF